MNTWEALAFFNLFVLAMLALDLGVFHRKAHAVSFREAALWSTFWVVLSVAFAFLIYFWQGRGPALEFFTAYILEKSLALDNLAVFALIFTTMAVPLRLQHKVLFWGVLGALVMRGVLILSGAALIAHLEWVLYIFAGILLVTAALLLHKSREEPPSARGPGLRLAHKLFPVTEKYQGDSFFLRRNGRLLATPLLVALIMIEVTDLLFAADSIPAVFTVTRDPFIAYSGTILAVLGLRSLYFLLAGTIAKLRYLRTGLSAVLIFLGAKMSLAHFYKLPVEYSLLVIVAILGATVVASLRWKRPLVVSAKPKRLEVIAPTREGASRYASLSENFLPRRFTNGNDRRVFDFPFDGDGVKACPNSLRDPDTDKPVAAPHFLIQDPRGSENASSCRREHPEEGKIVKRSYHCGPNPLRFKPPVEISPQRCALRRHEQRRRIHGLRKILPEFLREFWLPIKSNPAIADRVIESPDVDPRPNWGVRKH